MRRTQLYLDEQMWNALHSRALLKKTTVSELVREAVRERYLGDREDHEKAMLALVGIRKEATEPVNAVKYVRSFRSGSRLDKLRK